MATQPPGSLGLPFVGEALAFLEDPFTFQSSRTQQHGEVWKTRILGSNVVFFSGPRALTFFLDPANFTREKGSPPHLQELLGHDAVPFIDGDVHRTRKRLLLQAFTKGALAGYVPGLQALVARATSALALDAETRLNPVLEQLAFDVANRLFAGAPPELSDAAMAAEFSRVVQGAFAPPINLPFTVYGKALKARDKLRAYIHEAVSTRDGAGTALAVLKAARGPGGTAGFRPVSEGGSWATPAVCGDRLRVVRCFGRSAVCSLYTAVGRPPVQPHPSREAAASTSG